MLDAILGGLGFSTIVLIMLVLIIMMFVPPLRALLGWALKQSFDAIKHLLSIAFVALQHAVVHVARAHGTIIKNLMPRNTVLPSVREKTTRRQ